MDEEPRVQTMDRRSTDLGSAQYIRIFTPNYQKLSWREIWDCFCSAFPDKWAVQVFPARGHLVDDANIYHLFVFDEPPRGMDISLKYKRPFTNDDWAKESLDSAPGL